MYSWLLFLRFIFLFFYQRNFQVKTGIYVILKLRIIRISTFHLYRSRCAFKTLKGMWCQATFRSKPEGVTKANFIYLFFFNFHGLVEQALYKCRYII